MMKPNRYRILIIDDTPANIEMLYAILQPEYSINVATSGQDAVELAKNNPPDLILLDIVMPGMDGYATCAALKTAPQTANIPVIFVTALNSNNDEEKGFTMGGVDFITKPFNPSIVLARVKTHLALYNQNRELDRLIQQRTAELSKSKEAAEAASQAKSLFLANISHELRTPLNGIQGMAQLLADSELNTAQKELLSFLNQSAVRLTSLVSSLLELSHIETDTLKIDRKMICLEDTLQPLLDVIQEQAQVKSLSFSSQFDDSIPKQLFCDPGCLKQILTNVLSNAVRYTPKGTVRLHVKPHGGQQEQSSRFVNLLFTVQDTGTGMSKETQKHIFKSFTIAEDYLTKEFSGAGLGLSITRSLTRKLGGRIWVESEEGKGSTFFILLPFEIVREAAARESTAAASGAEHTLQILLVEDDPISQAAGKGLLELSGHKVTVVPDGELALAALVSNQYDIILMDIQLPGPNGIEITHRIRDGQSGRSAAQTPVIALTAFAENKRLMEESSGFQAVLGKPYSRQELLDTINLVLLETRQQGLP
ncbi:response regulator [Desulfovibrio mangrovi]|uniref:response regulator n=1 Tax=Desulfovibrio mangrovi TaxID=2976983 RepID=UPI002246AAF9|nr:response regulator [Desulfovibrio mangrovi]UZP67771.1 response regulator [Desulfovibrio mangrovi]